MFASSRYKLRVMLYITSLIHNAAFKIDLKYHLKKKKKEEKKSKMNLFRNNEVKIDYNTQMKRFSLAKNEEWVSITHTSFHVMLVMMDVKTDYDQIVINQNCSQLEIIKIFKNFMLEFKCKNFTSVIVISDSTMHAIYNVRDDIWKTVNSMKPIKNHAIIEKTNSQRNDNMKTSSIHNTNNTNQIHDVKLDICNKFKTPMKKSQLLTRMTSKRKHDTTITNNYEPKKGKIVCSNENDDTENRDDVQTNNGE